MKRLLPLAILLLAACGDSGNATAVDQAATSPPTPAGDSPTTATGTSTTPAAATQAAGGIPAACQEGFGSYLTTIEPLVEAYDPATASLAEFADFENAVQEKSFELLSANNSTAPYSCSQINLEWAYFDANSPWDAILPFAGERAPGTVAYLETLRDVAATDEAQLDAYVAGGCDAAVAAIQQAVSSETAAGSQSVGDLPVAEAVELLGLYSAYMSQVQQEACPRDALGNAEFGFIGTF